MRTLLWAAIFALTHGLQFVSRVEKLPVCISRNTLQNPVSGNPITINRVAWPVLGPGFSGPITINDVPPVAPPTVICLTCESPPCPIMHNCEAPSLFWTVEFDNLLVQPGLIVLSDAQTVPDTLITFFSTAVPTQWPTPLPNASAPGQPPACPAAAPVAEPCPLCPSNNSPSSSIVGISVALAFILATCGGLCTYIWANQKVGCPYCNAKVPAQSVRMHLNTCAEHLKLFNPTIVDQVHIVRQPITVPIEDHEDDVARPESIAFVGATM